MSIFGIIALVVAAFVVMVYVIKINDDIRVLEDRLNILECEVRYGQGIDNDRN